ncbi:MULTISPECIES: PDR/VanB family oxidoreductase [Methylobacterium]|uniref:Carnitine monooxygenase reductase subunit n=2 Tax=Pseudomonadota TaxID=1224 RepID=A0ABQ4SUP6_9HYPH|nr:MULTISPECIES: PDR/VanB family oxidoreductase [Methylobacterium]PIU07301.1 MAG: oxidoreductase [Methylobacterium sp. CG09_land_8_20_14_0_10_71_15]PIU14248.1 MAG: oxidoreductase [Methylobacterium sp. CG08_land_8_20_14_0_20_71_15]GBU19429.1 putative dioxygenase beta subunit [Methylobacterium sp.]GJE06817.1 Carnitine monooxygenase reductase subunit [Methylobacterium jeotgali]
MILDRLIPARVAGIDSLGPTLKRFRFEPESGRFPTAAPGAHILVTLRGPERVWKNAYSLVTPPDQRDGYAIIVRRVRDSRGGSHFLHDHLRPGDRVEIGPPASLFPIASLARRHILIGGGIGLTPFLSYVPVLRARGAAFELHQYCTDEETGIFRELLAEAGAGVTVHGETSRRSFTEVLTDQPLGTHVYTCGPAGMMEAVEAAARDLGWPEAAIHKESFGGAEGGRPFRVTLARSGRTLDVPETQSLLEALETAGIEAPCLCRGGACGVCLTGVVDGEIEHRDHVLTEEERAGGRLMATCVSRARSDVLVLDL